MDAVTGLFQPIGEQGERRPMRQRFQGGVHRLRYSGVSIYGYTAERCACGIRWALVERKAENHRDAYSIQREIVRTDTAYPGEIVILPSDSVRLNDVLGDPTRLPRKRWREDPLPMLRTSIAPKTAAQRERLLDALTQLADTDPLLRCEVDSITHEIILSFLVGCSWRLFPLCCRKKIQA